MLATTRSSDLRDDASEDTTDYLAGAPFPAANGKLTRLPELPHTDGAFADYLRRVSG